MAPVPLSASVLPWLSLDAERWRAAHPAPRAVAWLLTGAWVAALVATAAQSWDTATCTERSPCRVDWPGTLWVCVAGASMVWLHRRPGLALAGSLSTAALVLASSDLRAAVPGRLLAALVLVCAMTAALAVRALIRRRRQQVLGQEAAGGLHISWPVRVPTRSRSNRLVLRVVSWSVLAAAVATYAGVRMAVDDAHAGSAAVVVGRVTAHLDHGAALSVTAGGTAVRVGTLAADGYPLGSQVTLLESGSWRRLRAEPYDPTLPGALALGLLLVAMTAGATEVRLRRGVRELAETHPALRVLVGRDQGQRVAVFAVDAGPDGPALLRLPAEQWVDPGATGADPLGTERDVGAPGWWGEESGAASMAEPAIDSPVDLEGAAELLGRREEGILHGLPYDGGVVALHIPGPGTGLLLLPTGLVVAGRSQADPAAPMLELDEGRRRAAATLAFTVEPRVFATGRSGSAIGLVLGCAVAALGAFLVSGGGYVRLLAVLVTGCLWQAYAVLVGSWFVVADADGVVLQTVRGPQRRAWDEIAFVDARTTGALLVTHDDARTVEVKGPLGLALLRHLGLRNAAERIGDNLNAMLREPTLRPLTRWDPDQVRLAGRTALGACLAYAAVLALAFAWGRDLLG